MNWDPAAVHFFCCLAFYLLMLSSGEQGYLILMINTAHLYEIQIIRWSLRQQESAEISAGGTKTVQAHTVMMSFQYDDEKLIPKIFL